MSERFESETQAEALEAWFEARDAYEAGEGAEPGAMPEGAAELAAAEAAALEELTAMGTPVPSARDADIADALLARHRAQPARPAGASDSRLALWVVGAMASIAAVLVGWVMLRPPALHDEAWRVESGRFADLMNHATAFEPGDTLRAGWVRGDDAYSCLGRDGAQICGAAELQLLATQPDPTRATRFDILQGQGQAKYAGAFHVALFSLAELEAIEPDIEEVRFEVQLEPATATRGERATVHVLEGRVAASGSAQVLDAERRILSAGDRRVFERMSPQLADAGSLPPTEDPVEVPAEAIEIGEPVEEGGEAPPSPIEAAAVEQAPPTASAKLPRARKETPKSETEAEPATPALSAAELLAEARRRKGAGDMAGAESTYAELLRAYPQSAEAHASQISVGQLRLRSGKARAALANFEAYIARGGALLEEAHWGRIQALHRLGKASQRDTAVEALQAGFPGSPYLARARELAEDEK